MLNVHGVHGFLSHRNRAFIRQSFIDLILVLFVSNSTIKSLKKSLLFSDYCDILLLINKLNCQQQAAYCGLILISV